VAEEKPQKLKATLGLSQEYFEAQYQDQNRSSKVTSPVKSIPKKML
jgi:hypothetical protein